jgi:hypothetical protein
MRYAPEHAFDRLAHGKEKPRHPIEMTEFSRIALVAGTGFEPVTFRL